jgi:hypothetical protein
VPRDLLADMKAFEKKLSLLHKPLQLADLQTLSESPLTSQFAATFNTRKTDFLQGSKIFTK